MIEEDNLQQVEDQQRNTHSLLQIRYFPYYIINIYSFKSEAKSFVKSLDTFEILKSYLIAGFFTFKRKVFPG